MLLVQPNISKCHFRHFPMRAGGTVPSDNNDGGMGDGNDGAESQLGFKWRSSAFRNTPFDDSDGREHLKNGLHLVQNHQKGKKRQGNPPRNGRRVDVEAGVVGEDQDDGDEDNKLVIGAYRQA